MNSSAVRYYNPDWLTDDALVANFIARQEDFQFLRDELSNAPLIGDVQHYLLVGLRGAGKTTLLKRLAISIRRDPDLQGHLIALSFPEELYQVKNLADFWWAACDALVEELDIKGNAAQADDLADVIDKNKSLTDRADQLSNAGLLLLQKTCEQMQRRPVLLVDNLDMVFQRIDKAGRKLNDPHAPAYWALREALSTKSSPIVIGGSVRLSAPFTDYDKAFYDFFVPMRLGRLNLDEVRKVLEHMADSRDAPEVKQRLQSRPSRIEVLFELTGGNLRALNLIFELLCHGPNSHAVEDFERLMDTATPYYKARFEDFSEQAQVVMHALAVRRPEKNNNLRFGHTASEIAAYAGLPTSTVSAQMDTLVREGVVEKSSTHGRTQYRISEQLFRLWLQMRSTRRIRQNVIGLTEFLEAMYDFEELQENLKKSHGASALADAKFAFAVADAKYAAPMRQELESYGIDRLRQHLEQQGGEIDEYLPSNEINENSNGKNVIGKTDLQDQGVGINDVTYARDLCKAGIEAKQKGNLAEAEKCFREAIKINSKNSIAWRNLGDLLSRDESGRFDEAEQAYIKSIELDPDKATAWRNLGRLLSTKLNRFAEAEAAYRKAIDLDSESKWSWFYLGNLLENNLNRFGDAELAYRKATEITPKSDMPWSFLGKLLARKLNRPEEAVDAYRKALDINPENFSSWNNLGNILTNKLKRFEEAEQAYRKAIEKKPDAALPWVNLARLFSRSDVHRFDEAEQAYRKSIELDSNRSAAWRDFGRLLDIRLNRIEEAEKAYHKAISINPEDSQAWFYLAIILQTKLNNFDKAEEAYLKAIEFDPDRADIWNDFGIFLIEKMKKPEDAEKAFRKVFELDSEDSTGWLNLATLLASNTNRFEEAEAAYRRAIEIDEQRALTWMSLGNFLSDKLGKFEEAEKAYRKAIEIDPNNEMFWVNLGSLLADDMERFEEAEIAYRKAIALAPESDMAWFNLGSLLINNMNRFEEGIMAYRQVISIDPKNAEAWNNLGTVLGEKMHSFEEAEMAFRKAIEINQKEMLPWLNLGHLMEKIGRLDEAISCYEKAIGNGYELGEDAGADIDVVKAKLCILSAKKALNLGDASLAKSFLANLLTLSNEISTILVSRSFVEEFLAPMLKDKNKSSTVLEIMHELHYGKYARPLLLAFEAAKENSPNMLEDIEPELIGGAKRMYERFMEINS